MGFLSNLFGGGGGAAKEQVRRLSHPRDIRTGDILKFRYLDQPELSNTEFEVAQINTYIYGNLCYPELVLKDRTGTLLYMMYEEEDGEEYLALSKKIDKAKISDVIPSELMTSLRTWGTGKKINPASVPQGFEEWLVNNYREVDDDVKGAFVKGDARYLSDEDLQRQEHFTSYILEDDEGEYAIEIEVYETGETEMCATVYHDLQAIEEMWPAQQSGAA
jgi:hypothetical protein